MIRCLLATEDRVYVGTGASLGATPTSSKAGLFVLDRATNEYTSILPAEFADAVEVRDVDADSEQGTADRARWTDHVPVVLLDGEQHSLWFVDEAALSRALLGR